MLENAVLMRLRRAETDGLDAGTGDANHFTGLDFTDVGGIEKIESAGFAGDDPGILAVGGRKLAEDERTEAAGIADGVEFVLREDEEGVGAFDLIECVAERAGEIAGLRAGDEMDDDFGVAIRLEDGATMLELAAPVGGVGEIAIVADGDFALVAIDHDGLGVEDGFVAGGGIAGVADGAVAGELCEDAGDENFLDFAHGAVDVEIVAVAGDDPGGLLAAVLQRVETEIGEVGGFGMAEDAEDTTFVVEVIVLDDFQIHEVFAPCRLNSNHVAGRHAQMRITAMGSKTVKASAPNEVEPKCGM